MRHRRAHRKLGRPTQPRQALLKNLARSFVLSGRTTTTEAKAKELRPYIEKVITRAREDTLHNRRIAYKRIPDRVAIRKLFQEIAPRYRDRKGGYTRIIKLPPRTGDAAPLALIELV